MWCWGRFRRFRAACRAQTRRLRVLSAGRACSVRCLSTCRAHSTAVSTCADDCHPHVSSLAVLGTCHPGHHASTSALICLRPRVLTRRCSLPHHVPPPLHLFFFFLIIRPPPRSPLFPYTPLSR